MAVDALLWDFGDTLCDESFMRQPHPDCLSWDAAWEAVMAANAGGWNRGQSTWCLVAAELARVAGLDVTAVDEHADVCCRQIAFFPEAWTAAQSRVRRQALVTINPDLFLERVVPLHGLESVFDQIVVSAAEGTDNKADLCDIALQRLGADGERSRTVLIDNSPSNIEEWKSRGGSGYLFTSDGQFAADWASLLS